MSFDRAASTASVTRLGWARAGHGRFEHRLVLDKLSHEAEVGRDVVFATLDKVEGALERVVVEFHQVSDDHGDRSRHAGVAVD